MRDLHSRVAVVTGSSRGLGRAIAVKLASLGAKVVVNYRGTLINGTEFDSSKLGQPATLEVYKVIPGWREALKLMPVGSKWQLFVPPELAYGTWGAGRDIGPNETLIFELELLAIK